MRLLFVTALAALALGGCARSPAPDHQTGSAAPNSASCRAAGAIRGDASDTSNIASAAGGGVLANEFNPGGSAGVNGYDPGRPRKGC
jgi:hypothetical protein